MQGKLIIYDVRSSNLAVKKITNTCLFMFIYHFAAEIQFNSVLLGPIITNALFRWTKFGLERYCLTY